MTAERLLEVMDEQQREAAKRTYLNYRDKCMTDRQALKLAVLDVMESDLMQKLIESDQKTTIYTDEGQPVQVFADKLVDTLMDIGVKSGWGCITREIHHSIRLKDPVATTISLYYSALNVEVGA